MFSRPMELSIPEGVSTMRGGGFPGEGSSESPLTTTAPRPAMSPCGIISRPYPQVPDASITGFGSSRAPILTLRSGVIVASHSRSRASKTGPCWQASR